MKKFFLILFSASVISFFAAAQTSDAIRQYINTYKELAISEEIRTGVPASITLAQGILESQAGRSKLCIASNNHFGIKCKNDWTGATVSYDDDTKGECFRSYPTAEDSYRDHSDFLRNRPNYASLFLLDPTDYVSWAYGLKKSGYATESAYGQMLVKVINENNLHSFTLVALERIKNGEVYYAANGNQGSPVANASLNSSGPSVDNTTQREIPEYKEGDYPAGVFTINQTKVLYVSAGTSLFAIATNNNIAFKRLQEFNDLDNVDILGKDQLIYLEKKSRKSNNKEYHIVAASETIEDIAQKEGVELESLFAYNKMQKGLEPMTGEKVYLRPGKPSYYPKLFAKKSFQVKRVGIILKHKTCNMSTIKVHDKYFVPYLSEDEIQHRISNLASQLNKDYEGKRPLFVAILNGSFMFASDLFKYLNIDAEICFIKLASYKGTKSTGHVITAIGLDTDITHRDIVIVEDIIDTGKTLNQFLPQLINQQPASLRIAALLHKPEATIYPVKIDYCGFSIPNKFVVGYGLDYDGHGRNISSIYQLKET